MAVEIKPDDLITEVMVAMAAVIAGTHRLMLVENDGPPGFDRTATLALLDECIVSSRSYGSNISTEDGRQRYGREQGLQEFRVALVGERLPQPSRTLGKP